MSKSLQQAVADAHARRKEEKKRELTRREKQLKLIERVSVRISLTLAHDELKDLGVFGVEEGLGFRFSLPSYTTDNVLIEVFEDRVLLKRGREFFNIPIRALNDDALVEVVAFMMVASSATSAHIKEVWDKNIESHNRARVEEVLDKSKTKRKEKHASL